MIPDITKQTLDIIIATVNTLSFSEDINEIYLFGSYAKNTYQKSSDIDLCVVASEQPTNLKVRGFKSQFTRLSNSK